MAVTDRTLRLVDDLRRRIDTVVDRATRDIVVAWATALDEVMPDLTAALAELLVTPGERITRAQMLRSQRLMRSLAVITDRLGVLAADAGVRITGDLADLVDMAGSAQASVIDSQLPPGSRLVDPQGWDRVDARQLEAIVQRSTERIVSSLAPLPDEVMAVVRRELIRGVAAGSNPRATAARMVQRAEQAITGEFGLTRALRIARTEQLDAYREAARMGRQAHADVLQGWTWVATLDARTCPSCWSQHGTVHPVDERGPDDHVQGRCAAVPKTKSWRDLGIGLDEPADLTPDAEAVFSGLPVAEQRQILGRRRFDAWQDGDYPMGAWSVRRENPGWRPSYQVSPAPPSGGRRSRNAA